MDQSASFVKGSDDTRTRQTDARSVEGTPEVFTVAAGVKQHSGKLAASKQGERQGPEGGGQGRENSAWNPTQLQGACECLSNLLSSWSWQ